MSTKMRPSDLLFCVLHELELWHPVTVMLLISLYWKERVRPSASTRP